MGHLLKQPCCREKIKVSDLDVAELIFVYASQFSNLPWRVPLCLESEFNASFDIKDRIEEEGKSENRTHQQLIRTKYLPEYGGVNVLEKNVYEVDITFAQDVLLFFIYSKYKNKFFSKRFMERLFETLPSANWVKKRPRAVTPYDGVKMDFWLELQESRDVDYKELFIYETDLAQDFNKTIGFLKEEALSQGERGIELLVQKLVDGCLPNSVDKEFFPLADALVRFTIDRERVPFQSGKKDKKELWKRVVLAASRFKGSSDEVKTRTSFIEPGTGKKQIIESSDVAKHVNTTYYPKLVAQVAMLLLPEDDGFTFG